MRIAAFEAAVVYARSLATSADPATYVLWSLLDIRSSIPETYFPRFLSLIKPLATQPRSHFQLNFRALLDDLPGIILSRDDSTPTIAKSLAPSTGGTSLTEEEASRQRKKNKAQRLGLEIMLIWLEGNTKSAVEIYTENWPFAIVECCLRGMLSIEDDHVEGWIATNVRSLHATLSSSTLTAIL